MVNGKRKGNQKEREVSKTLSLWISKGVRDDLLWRSTSSGGQFNRGSNRQGRYKTQAGDIQSIDPLSRRLISSVSLEVKHYKDLQVSNLIYKRPSKLRDFWIEHLEVSRKAGTVPVLIGKENFKPEIILLPKYLKLPGGILIDDFRILLLDEFLRQVSYEQFQDLVDKHREGKKR